MRRGGGTDQPVGRGVVHNWRAAVRDVRAVARLLIRMRRKIKQARHNNSIIMVTANSGGDAEAVI